MIETFADLNGHPAALSPSTFVIVRRNKKKRNQPYQYPQVLHPNHYFPTAAPTDVLRSDYSLNTNQRSMLTPYTSVVTTRETTTNVPMQSTQPFTPQQRLDYNPSNLIASPSVTTIAAQPSIPLPSQTFRPPVTSYTYQTRPPSPPTTWYRTESNTINRPLVYLPEPTPSYLQRDIYLPNRSQTIDRSFDRKQEPRMLHYYTGYDYFATPDPSEFHLTRHHPPLPRPGTAIRYGVNPSYHSTDYIKSTL